MRLISQPALEVKVVQRALVAVLLRELPVHQAATAYMPGSRLVDNVLPHANAGPILKLDLKDFFPSIVKEDWVIYCKQRGLLDDDEIDLTSSILFQKVKGGRRLRLAIGAPSSPILSNILMFDFDEAVTRAVGGDRVVYTRYADDMTFSAPRTGFINTVVKSVFKIVRETKSPSLWINNDKTTYVTKKYHRVVTGLTLSNDGKVTIGRSRKRQIRAAVHRASEGKLDGGQMQQLAGWLAFVKSAEPGFISVLERGYGDQLIKTIQRNVRLGQRVDRERPLFDTA